MGVHDSGRGTAGHALGYSGSNPGGYSPRTKLSAKLVLWKLLLVPPHPLGTRVETPSLNSSGQVGIEALSSTVLLCTHLPIYTPIVSCLQTH
jgi:hypothetical protein